MGKLDLSYMHLEVLPEWMAESFPKLTHFSAHGNGLTEFPDNFQSLNLEYLNVYNNSIHEIPDWICGMTSLKELHISHNEISTIPDCIDQLVNLEVLGVWENDIHTIPESVGNLKNIRVVSFAGNALHSLPDNLYNHWGHIDLLDLSHNEFPAIPPSILTIPHQGALPLWKLPHLGPPPL